MSELRWNALLGQWVATATHRNERTFLPAADDCPFCRMDPATTVFKNDFPSLRIPPPEPAIEGTGLFAVAPAMGVCEVVLYTPRHDATLADMDAGEVRKLVDVWTDRYRELGEHDDIAYVYIFENKGEEVGVTLHHPHGQIYAYPFIPPVIATELEHFARYEDEQAACLLCDLREDELQNERRVIASDESFTAFVPFAARWPYEVHIVSTRHFGALTDLDDDEKDRFSQMLSRVVRAYDRVFSRPFPYVMALHQRPTGGRFSGYHFHVEFYPPLRAENRLKFIAGSELGAGMFINDTLPEETAAQLRAVMP